jgi:hypothetical protein
MTEGLLTLTEAGDTSAELALLYLPRLLLPKKWTLREALTTFPTLTPTHSDSQVHPNLCVPPNPPTQEDDGPYVAAVQSACEVPSRAKLLRLLDRPIDRSHHEKDDPKRFFPAQDLWEEESQDFEQLWNKYGDGFAEPLFSFKDLRGWAYASGTSSGAEVGWTGELVKVLFRTNASTARRFADYLARPPHKWNNTATAAVACRVTTGWLIQGQNKARPIAAPMIARRIATRALMRKARAAVNRYCIPKGQLGMASESLLLAYTFIPQAALADNGTVRLADRSMSYQTISRKAVYQAVEDFSREQFELDPEGTRAVLTAAMAFYATTSVFGERFNRSTVNFREAEDLIYMDGLPQGCTLSPTLEALVLAWAGKDQRGSAQVTLQAHDDVCVTAWDAHANVSLPSSATAGGEYNALKSKLITADSHSNDSPSLWGRPVHNFAAWLDGWKEKYTTRVENILRVHQSDPGLAITAAMKCGGPNAFLHHALKAFPLQHARELDLRHLDSMWNTLLYRLAGYQPEAATELAGKRPYNDHAKVTRGSVHDCRVDAALKGVELATKGVSIILGQKRADDLLRLRDALDRSQLDSLLRSHTSAAGVKPPNTLWYWALQPATHSDVLRFAQTTRTFAEPDLGEANKQKAAGLPQALALANVLDIPYSPDLLGSERRTYAEPCHTCQVPHGRRWQHPGKCANPPIGATHLRRHNLCIPALVATAKACGCRAEEHDARIPTLASGKRPADWLEEDPGWAKKHICADLTIVGEGNLARAVSNKEDKYRTELRATSLKLNVFAVDENGLMGGHTEAVLARWTRTLTATRKARHDPPGNPTMEVKATVGRAFAQTMAHWFVWHARPTVVRRRRGPVSRTKDTASDRRIISNNTVTDAPVPQAVGPQHTQPQVHPNTAVDRGTALQSSRVDYARAQTPIHTLGRGARGASAQSSDSDHVERSARNKHHVPPHQHTASHMLAPGGPTKRNRNHSAGAAVGSSGSSSDTVSDNDTQAASLLTIAHVDRRVPQQPAPAGVRLPPMEADTAKGRRQDVPRGSLLTALLHLPALGTGHNRDQGRSP